MGPLNGIRVIEIAIGIQGPYAGMLLGDMGADVVKVEPLTGEPTRHVGSYGPVGHESGPMFFACNRNKRSLAIDMSTEEGRGVVLKLLDGADVFLSNNREYALGQLGLSYETLASRNPRLVYLQASAFGPRGPKASLAAVDIVALAEGGIVAHTGLAENGPTPPGAAIADHSGALWAAYGIVLALFARERSGRGQRVDVSLLGSQIGLQAWELAHFFLSGEEPGLGGRGHGLAGSTWGVYKAADGWVASGVVMDSHWEGFKHALDNPQALENRLFADMPGRRDNGEVLREIVSDAIKDLPAAEVVSRMETARHPMGMVKDYKQIAADLQALENDYIIDCPVAPGVAIGAVGFPVGLSATSPSIRRPPPGLGDASLEILHELGYGRTDIDRLARAGIVNCGTTTSEAER